MARWVDTCVAHPDSRPAPSVVLSWSGGKDSALALHAMILERAPIAGLLTTIVAGDERVGMHGLRTELVERQALALGLELSIVRVPKRAANATYESAHRPVLLALRERGVRRVACGDLFLEDVRAYRDRLFASVGLEGAYPLWGADTRQLARQFVDAGFRSLIVAVDPAQLDREFVGREFDAALLADLPPTVDPCGERGEFHTFVYDGPIFRAPVAVERGGLTERDGLVVQELVHDGATPGVPARGLRTPSC